MTVQDWPWLWTVRGRYGRRVIVRAELANGGQIHYETVDKDGFTDGGGYVDRAGFDLLLDGLTADYPSLRSEQ